MASRRQLTDPGTGAPVQRGRRAAVLQLLREEDGPLGAAEVADRVGIHLNTARFHLDGLVGEELAVRGTAPRDEPGRPKVVYSATAGDASEGSRSFRLLSDILLGVVSSAVDDPVAAATRAGKSWGAYLTDPPAPTERVGPEEGQRRLVATLEGMGFVTEADPEPNPGAGAAQGGEAADVAEDGGGETAEGEIAEGEIADGANGSGGADGVGPVPGAERRLHLHHCPFREVAQRRPDIVCAIHLGLMQGTVEALRTPLAAESLEPFVTPHLCVATLRRTDVPAETGR
ncbi:helix-turn-helix transcriptional regulator [Streptomyces sp. NPDC008313]|uniref:helix-turn-helix transcriptional regulator n=1 Tax=Streptomyces sp. NPDC008313 TaxID=3364826 RepID=UPI0036E742AD